MSESAANNPPAAPAADNDAPAPSKKAAKKAEAKAKKEAEKARRAAEREAQMAAQRSTADIDNAADNYGDITPHIHLNLPRLHVRDMTVADEGKLIKLRAWVQNSRMQGAKMAFLELREERNWSVQAIIAATKPDDVDEKNPVSKQMVKWVGSIRPESFVLVEAIVAKPYEPVKSCKVADAELHLRKVYMIAPGPESLNLQLAASNKPVSKLEDEDPADAAISAVESLSVSDTSASAAPAASLATHLNNPVMHKRAPVQQAIADVRMAVRKLFSEYLDAHEFVQFEPPCLIGAASEGGANVFRLPYFEKEAFLAQSPQFYKQIEIAGGRKRVYCIGPVFRAENSNTPRHMTEFTGLDLEMEIEDHYHEVRDMLEGVLLHIFRGLKQRCGEAIELVRSVYPCEEFSVPEPGHEVRLTFAEGQKLLREEGPEEFRDVHDDEDMSTPQEKALGALVRKKYGTDFYVLDKFPESARPFYTLEDPLNPSVTNAYDFFMRGQEILSGGQRIHLPGLLEKRLLKKGIDPSSPGIKEYVDVFRSAGVPPHGGGGIGLDRVVAWYLNLPSVQLADRKSVV